MYVFLILFGFLLLGVPIAFSLLCAVSVAIIMKGKLALFKSIPQRIFTQIDTFSLMAVPLFILAGNVMEKGGISKRLIAFLQLLLKRIAARLACICVVASAFFGAISGSNPATVAAIGGIMYPHMIERGYPKDVAAAIAATSGTLGVVIPPSIPMVTYGITASVSIGAMFMAGVVPGLLLALALCFTNIAMCKKYDAPDKTKTSSKVFLLTFRDALLALMMPIIILGGIYGGIFTATEAAAVSAVYAIVISMFVYKEVNFKKLCEIILASAISSAVIFTVIGCSAPFGYFLTSNNIPAQMSASILKVFSSKFSLVLMTNLVLLFLGCFLETQSIIILTTPVFLGIAPAMGMSPEELGILIVVNTSIGMITPPMGVNLFVACGFSGQTLEQVSKRLWPYLIAEVSVLLLISYVPRVISWFPHLLGLV